MTYINDQFRSILNGLGYRSRFWSHDLSFLSSSDDSRLTKKGRRQEPPWQRAEGLLLIGGRFSC